MSDYKKVNRGNKGEEIVGRNGNLGKTLIVPLTVDYCVIIGLSVQ